jgi:IS6 family transposase
MKIKKQGYYLYRAVDAAAQPIDVLLRKTRDANAAERFCQKALRATHTATPRAITVEKNAAYPPALATLQQEGHLPPSGMLRQCKYLNNGVEQDHRVITRRSNAGMGFGSFRTAERGLWAREPVCMELLCDPLTIYQLRIVLQGETGKVM